MKKISGSTFYLKFIFPLTGFVPLIFPMGSILESGQIKLDNMVALIGPLIISLGFIFVFMKHQIWDLSDEVFDNDDSLLFRKGKLEQSVKLKDIINISHGQFSSSKVIIQSKQAGELGKELSFILPTRFNIFSKNPTIADLIERVDLARNA